MHFTGHGTEYQLMRASDLSRDGMGLELAKAGETRVLAEVFYSDKTGEFFISLFEANLPLPVIERLIGSAKIALVPADRLHDR
jgi:hypothetical protein